MVRSALVVGLILIWLFATFTPSIITLFSDNGKALTTISMNEEEQHDGEKQDGGEKQLVAHYHPIPILSAKLGTPRPNQYYCYGTFNLATDVIVPPPELFS
tara:strand:- start:1778 stop:2080 length:303 start_codon:yes stop_codon:yes gene_type:complete